LLFCFVSWACLCLAQNASEETSKLETISGTVVNKLTREPISRALVFSSDNRLATFTGDDGRFQFEVPKRQRPMKYSSLQERWQQARLQRENLDSSRTLTDPKIPQPPILSSD
jgi:hypothetical protein